MLSNTWSRLTSEVGGRERLGTIALLAAVLGLDMADKGTASAVADQLKQSFQIGQTQLGLIFAVVSFVGGIATLPIGLLVDRISRRRILIAAVSAWVVATVLSATATSYVYLIVTRIALGVVTAAAWPCVASLIGDLYPPDQRAWIYGLTDAGELVGVGVGFFIAGEVSTFAGWRWAFIAMAVPAAILVWLLWRFLAEPERGSQVGRPAQGDARRSAVRARVREEKIEPRPGLVLHEDPASWGLWRVIGYLLRLPTYRLVILASGLAYYYFSGLRSFAMVYLSPQYRLSRELVSALVFALGVGALVGVTGGGRLSEALLRGGRAKIRITLPSIALFAVVPTLALALWTRNPWLGIPVLTLAALLLSAAVPPLDAARLDIIHPRMWGRAEAGRTAIRSIFEGAAPLLFGAMSGWLGGGREGLRWTFLIMLAPMLAAGALGVRARRTYLTDVATAAASVEATRRK